MGHSALGLAPNLSIIVTLEEKIHPADGIIYSIIVVN